MKFFTIGHSTRSIDAFLAMLHGHGVTSLRGYADYMQTPGFAAAIDALVARARLETVACMCAEAVPWRCHRSLIADALIVRGVDVADISGPTTVRPHRLTPFAHVTGTTVTYPSPVEGFEDGS